VTGTVAQGKKFVKFVPAAETIMAVDENGTSYMAGYAQVIYILQILHNSTQSGQTLLLGLLFYMMVYILLAFCN
jgi:hypothetical protein